MGELIDRGQSFYGASILSRKGWRGRWNLRHRPSLEPVLSPLFQRLPYDDYFYMGVKSPSPLDPLSPTERSERMGRVRGKDTKPELVVRRLLHSLGYRYRLHVTKLPGKPDLVFTKRRKVIFVHGCFWHRHEGCRMTRLPKTKLDFWQPKLEGNRLRDLVNQERLRAAGWNYLVIWECETRDREKLITRIGEFLGVR